MIEIVFFVIILEKVGVKGCYVVILEGYIDLVELMFFIVNE